MSKIMLIFHLKYAPMLLKHSPSFLSYKSCNQRGEKEWSKIFRVVFVFVWQMKKWTVPDIKSLKSAFCSRGGAGRGSELARLGSHRHGLNETSESGGRHKKKKTSMDVFFW